MAGGEPALSVIVPAFNEERWLPEVLESIRRPAEGIGPVEIVVVDNASTDGTAAAANAAGARVVSEGTKNLAVVRNAGARAAAGSVLMWVDADTPLPPDALAAVWHAMSDPRCLGGAFDALHRPRRPSVRAYLGLWRAIARATRMAQGAAQFARREAFEAIGGYDERLFMGEDVDFWWRLRRHAPPQRRPRRAHRRPAGAALAAPLRSVAVVADPGLHQPAADPVASALAARLEGVVRQPASLGG